MINYQQIYKKVYLIIPLKRVKKEILLENGIINILFKFIWIDLKVFILI